MTDEHRLDELAVAIGGQLKALGLKLSTAESCTGGWVAQVVTSVAGSSEWFERGFVTYSNASKVELLDVQTGTLERVGAVDEATAREMAQGAVRASRADLALAITGVAGPGGGTAQKPVGTVCFAWADRAQLLCSATKRFDGDRRQVRLQSVVFALEELLRLLGTQP